MEKDNKIIRVINSPIPASIIGGSIIIILQYVYRKVFYPMNTYSFFNFLIIGFLSVISSYVIYTYYYQKKEIQNLKNSTDHLTISIHHNSASIYHHLAAINTNIPYCSFLYTHLALEKYIEIKDQRNTRQLLNEIASIIKKIEKDKLTLSNISELNNTLSKLDQTKYKTEIEQINEIIKTIT